jgi:hypothetical protein
MDNKPLMLDVSGSKSRVCLRDALPGKIEPLFGNALWLEYEDLPGRPVWTDATSSEERQQVLAALAKLGRWASIYYGWRPDFPDEADNHLIELAMAGESTAIISRNVRDIRRGELLLNGLRVFTPADYLERTR